MRDWLAARAAATPRREALICGEARLSFHALNERVARLCAAWQRAGIQRGQHVALVMHSRVDTVLRLFASMRSGLVLVPLGARLTAVERAELLTRANCDWLLPEVAGEPLWRLQQGGQRSPHEPPAGLSPSEIARHLDGRLRPDAPHAIVHTSGTTGQPKGVVLSINNFFHSALGATFRLGQSPQDRWLCVMPLWHVGGLALLTRAMLQGVPVVLQPDFDSDAVLRALRHEAISHISLVPTMLHRLLERGPGTWSGNLRLILLGGAAASPALLSTCIERGLPVATTWGLTETASQVATQLPAGLPDKPGSVGKPLLFNRLRIVNEENQSLPPGATGEILICGPTVMRGYHNDPHATAAALRSSELHTGDLGYLDVEGDLYIVQRRSDLIISGGENVYPAEVERVLGEHPAVRAVAVTGIADAEWGQRVAAAVQLQPAANTSCADLSTWCRARLADYKLPRVIRFVEALPLTASGKLRRAEVTRLFED